MLVKNNANVKGGGIKVFT